MSGTTYDKNAKYRRSWHINRKIPDTVKLTHDMLYSYYSLKNPEPYSSRLCQESVWMGGGGEILVGDAAIRARHSPTKEQPAFHISDEKYFRFDTAVSSTVCASLKLGAKGSELFQSCIRKNLTFYYEFWRYAERWGYF